MINSFQFIFILTFFYLTKSACPNGSYEWSTNCYIFNSTEIGFAKAEVSCQQIGGHLISIHDAFTNDIIGQTAPDYFNKSSVTDIWIGANSLSSQKTWSWSDGSAMDFMDWKKGEPRNESETHCGTISMIDGFWSSEDCFSSKPFICMIPKSIAPTTMAPTSQKPEPSCPFGWLYFGKTNSCYGGLYGLYVDWQSAEGNCTRYDAHLPSVHSYEEHMFLNTFVEFVYTSIWIGMYSDDNGETWKYSDGTPVDYIPPESDLGEPSRGKTCVVIDSDEDSSCDVQLLEKMLV
uniref:C-type lectin domain-containing protein n=1 Tax=Panagrolaimus davidi TaxID=227884 RepID=A0A914QG72_9BILA